jgi:predicted nucleic acid-binding protein
MSHPGSWLNGAASLVSDASVWINLVATERAEVILRASSVRHLITSTALSELDAGRAKGRRTAAVVAELIEMGLVDEVGLGPVEEATFLSLVAGPVSETLDDGEAATIAYALGSGSVALIDERKATALCGSQFPSVKVMSTTDLLLSQAVQSALTLEDLADSLFRALSVARMRVPECHLPAVCGLLGPERRQQCQSLPALWRRPPDARLAAS